MSLFGRGPHGATPSHLSVTHFAPVLARLVSAGDSGDNGHVDLDIGGWHWPRLLGLLAALLLVDILVIHREAHVVHMPIAASLAIIGAILGVSIFASLKAEHDEELAATGPK